MNDNSDNNIRRSSRLHGKKRGNKINYKEIEEGKDSITESVHKNYEDEVLLKLKKKGDAKLSHPKKSLTAYTLFVKLKRKELQEKFPDATTPELMKEIGRQWKSIDEKEKAWYQSMALKDKERYKKEMDQMNKLKEFHKIDNCELKRPKKCLSSYMIFVREMRSRVTQDFPDMNALDVMKEVGRRWQSISAEDKNYYQALADKDKERFKRENQQYMKELEQLDTKMKNSKGKDTGEIGGEQEPDEEQNISGGNKSNENESKMPLAVSGKKMRRDPSMPKKPLSAYIYFSQEMREQIKKEHPKMPVAQIMKEVSNRWSAMSKKEKEPYIKEAREDKKRYEDEKSNLCKDTLVKIDCNERESQEGNEDENFADYESSHDNKLPKDKSPIGESWGDSQVKTTNKVREQPLPKEPVVDKPVPTNKEPTFRFNLPDNKPSNNMNQTSPLPFKKDNPSYMGGSSYKHPDTASGATDYNQNSNYIYRPMAFSPFGQNRSPGVSPNMLPMYSPMMMNKPDSYRDYSNRNLNNLSRIPSGMGQSTTQNNNRQDMSYNDSSIMNVSPGGFTPLRTNFQKQSPMFSPYNMDNRNYFNPSPNINGLSGQGFNNYGRTPVNTFAMAGNFHNRGNQGGQNTNTNPNQKSSGNNNEGIFDLNPFGS